MHRNLFAEESIHEGIDGSFYWDIHLVLLENPHRDFDPSIQVLGPASQTVQSNPFVVDQEVPSANPVSSYDMSLFRIALAS